jgi:hypothetical protein
MADFENTYDVTNDRDVAFPRTLEIGITGGQQVFPPPTPSALTANNLLIFTGTLLVNLHGDSGNASRVLRGIVKLRLNRSLSKNETFLGSATVAALGSIHTDEEEVTFAVDDVETIVADDHELCLVAHMAIQGEAASLSRMAYQANVLVHDLRPELDSILVRPAGSGAAFSSSALVRSGDAWEYQINLSGPAPDGGMLILLSSDKPAEVPIAAATEVPQGTLSAVFSADRTSGSPTTAVITARDASPGRSTSRSATVNLFVLG